MRSLNDEPRRHGEGRLPPQQITDKTLDEVGMLRDLTPDQRRAATMLAHYAFGATAGTLFGAVARHAKLPLPLAGALFGVGVWGASYFGWLPAIGLRRSARHDSASRNFQMIVAHIAWGITAGVLMPELEVNDL